MKPDYFILDVPSSLIGRLQLNESIWKKANVSDYWLRVDPARPEMHLRRHVHIAHQKHINAKQKQVSWDDHGSRHDRSTFNTSFKGMEVAKTIAKQALKLSDEITLESISPKEKGELLVESLLSDEQIPAERLIEIPVFRVRTSSSNRIQRAAIILEKFRAK